MFLIGSFIVFRVFFLNVALGAFADAAFLGDVGEMLVLFLCVGAFCRRNLKKEADRTKERRLQIRWEENQMDNKTAKSLRRQNAGIF